MTDNPEVISYWYAVDSNADKPYIKKEKGSGLLASFDCAEDAQRFCQWRQDVKCKQAQYVRLTDHEEAMRNYGQAMNAIAKDVGAGLASERAADKARIAELAEQRDSFQRVGIQSMTERDELLGLLKTVRSVVSVTAETESMSPTCQQKLRGEVERIDATLAKLGGES